MEGSRDVFIAFEPSKVREQQETKNILTHPPHTSLKSPFLFWKRSRIKLLKKMRTISASVFFLILLLMSISAQGIRLEKEFLGDSQKKIQVEVNSLTKRDQIGDEGGEACSKTTQCLGRSSRKLMNKKMEVEELSNPEISSKASVEPKKAPQATTKKYPDLMDLAGMDYSPVKRKPPIHN